LKSKEVLRSSKLTKKKTLHGHEEGGKHRSIQQSSLGAKTKLWAEGPNSIALVFTIWGKETPPPTHEVHHGWQPELSFRGCWEGDSQKKPCCKQGGKKGAGFFVDGSGCTRIGVGSTTNVGKREKETGKRRVYSTRTLVGACWEVRPQN